MNYKYTYESPLGTMIMIGTLSYLTDLFFIDEDYSPSYDAGKAPKEIHDLDEFLSSLSK